MGIVHLALAIDSGMELWGLDDGLEVESAIAHVLAGAIGSDVLIYRVGEQQGGYFGVARLAAVRMARGADTRMATFDQLRMFANLPPHPAGVTALTRLQFLDDAEFDAIMRMGEPTAVPLVAREPERGYLGPPLDTAIVSAVLDSLRREVRQRCAFTGEQVQSSASEIAVIWPKGVRLGLHLNNFLLLVPDAYAAFRAGHFTARDDGTILIDGRIDRGLLARMNPTGRLVLPDNPALRPAPDNLDYHRRIVFRLV